jgi:RNA polymerase sigma-70 factor (ECF subfamily)
MSEAQRSRQQQIPDPALWVDQYGDYLFKYAIFRLRDSSAAEDVVQETLLAALQAYDKFAGKGSEKTWLTGILKHKVIDHFRRTKKESKVDLDEGREFEHPEMFMQTGEWVGHWAAILEPDKGHIAPMDWNTNPATLLEQTEFWLVFQDCLSPLPERIASAFTLREIDGLKSEDICDVLGISVNNLWVMLHRARTHLRYCIELNWFRREPKAK